jgi:hypothetical protein
MGTHSIIVDPEDQFWLKFYPWHLSNGYVSANGGAKSVYLHRVIMNAPDGLDVDHINHNKLDNRKENLRVVSRSQNCMNRKGPDRDNTSGYRGVTWSKKAKKWQAQLAITHFIGYFENREEAAAAARKARARLMTHSGESE